MANVDPLDGIDRIPDPAAARVAHVPVPPATLPADPSPTRDDRRRFARVAIVVACVWIGAVLAAAGVRADITAPLVITQLVAWALTVVVGLVFVLRPRARGLPAPVRAVQHALWIVPAIYVAAVIAVGALGTSSGTSSGPPSGTMSAAGGPPFGWSTVCGCLGLATLMALGPLLGAAVLLRGSFLSASAWRGAAVGALAGLAGSIGVHAHCPVPALDHLFAAHGPAILVGALLGGILGRSRGSA